MFLWFWPLCRYQLAEANSQINLDCTNLSPGEVSPVQKIIFFSSNVSFLYFAQQICLGIVGRDCNIVYTVQSGDTCPSIASNTGISVEQFLIDNPNIDAYCSNITPGDVRVFSLSLTKYNNTYCVLILGRLCCAGYNFRLVQVWL